MTATKRLRLLWPILLVFAAESLLLLASFDTAPYLFTLTFVFFLVFGWLQIAIHELGHLVFGLVTGYRFLSYRIFTWVVVRENGKIRLKRQTINEALAQCLMVPKERWDEENYPFQLYLSGGVIFNALFSLAALLLLQTNIFYPIHVWLFAAIGLYLVFSNTIPKRMNDGNILKKCRQNKDYRKMMYHQLRTVSFLSEGKQLSQLPSESFALSNGVPMEDPFSLYVVRLEYYKHLEQFDFDSAADLLERQWQMKDQIELMDRIMIAAERLFCLSVQKQTEEARQLYYHPEIQHILKFEQVTFKRLFAAYYLYVEQNPAKAVVWCKAGLHLLKSDFFDNSTEIERNLLMWLKKEAEIQLAKDD